MKTKQKDQVALLEEQRTSGQTVREFCERKGISIERFKWWQRAQRRRELDVAASSFLPVIVEKPQDDHTACRIVVGGLVSIECRSATSRHLISGSLSFASRQHTFPPQG